MKQSDAVRKYAGTEYIAAARRKGQDVVRIVAGDVHRALKLNSRLPLVCSALKSRKFLEDNRLEIEKREGPPSGMSSTVAFTYRLLGAPDHLRPANDDWFMSLRGISKDVFESLGGGEAFIRRMREHFYEPDED